MARRRSYTPEQIITKLREVEILLSQGKSVKEASKLLEINEQTYYRWRREYGGMDVTQAKKLKDMEKENARLKKLVADPASARHLRAVEAPAASCLIRDYGRMSKLIFRPAKGVS